MWTVITVLILLGIFIFTIFSFADIAKKSDEKEEELFQKFINERKDKGDKNSESC